MPIQADVSPPATITAEELAALIAERDALAGALRVATTERDLALERLRSLQRQLFAAKSEARGTDQKDLFLNDAEALAPSGKTLQAEVEDIDEKESTPVADHQRKQRGRKPLDPTLPREIVRHELPEAERVCAHDGHALVEIGAEVSEQMDVIPEQVRVRRDHGPGTEGAWAQGTDEELHVGADEWQGSTGAAVRLCAGTRRRARREAVCWHPSRHDARH